MRLRRFFLHNFWWKLTCLSFAVVLWFALVGEPEFNRPVSKRVPVHLSTRGNPADGYRVTSQTAEPEMIDISGPQSSLQAIESVQTPEIDVTGATGSREVRVNAYVSDPQVQVVSPVVNVRLTIEKGLDNSHP